MRDLTIIALVTLLASLSLFITSCEETEWPAGLPHSEVILPNFEDPDTPGAYFDFSEGKLVYGDEGRQRGDIYLDRTFIAGNPALGVALHDSQPDTILYDLKAPGWGSSGWKTPPGENSPARISITNHMNIWVKTAEGHTAKLRILMQEPNPEYSSLYRVKFEWIYQPDGSEELHALPGAESEPGTE